MSTIDEHPGHVSAKKINTAFLNAPNNPFRNVAPDEYGQLIASLVHFIEGAEVRYVTARFADDGGTEAEVVVFTDRLVIRGTLSGTGDSWQGGTFTAEARARSALTAMSVQSRHNMYAGSWEQWPDRYSVTLTYPDLTVTIPATPAPSDREQRELDALTPTLRADLER